MPRGVYKRTKEKEVEKVVEKHKEKKPEVKSSGKICSGCNHSEDMHYGSEKKWCNTSGCQCQELS